MNTANNTSIEAVRSALQMARCDSYLEDLGEHETAYLKQVAKKIDAFRNEYEKRFGEIPDPFEFLKENPDKGASFIQWIAGEELSTELTIMVWRILAGAEILAVNYQYLKDDKSILEIQLDSGGAEPDRYLSDRAWDFHLLAELRMLLFNDKPYLVGSFRPVI